ncbi:PKD domain-containing protein [Hymenobacter sp. GOD-10R]|uniref:PKD domain-containing protein n=1 Tax=Hymenobacter sp. GOD-10R TaxID=3093922 RepID=UPI002D792DC3|nr:PKD domain-containing protein [Hymenobacter sp. GOD-10R]WRQ30561.1 PKD domain-containing protein [Hymenobacter sp. GOD-10R]
MRKLATVFMLTLFSSPLLAQTGGAAKGDNPLLQRSKVTAAAPDLILKRPDPNSRISGSLQQLYAQWQNAGASRGAATSMQTAFSQLNINDDEQSVMVRITAQDVAALRPLLAARGFKVISDQSKLHFIEGLLPLSQLAPGKAGVSALATNGLLGIKSVSRPMNNVGRIQNQADYILESNRVRAALPTGYDGTGQRIGVMSDSYNALGGAPGGVASGDLPANVQVLQDYAAGADEGRGMLELVHDVAPGAGLAFSSVFISEANFADQIRRLASPSVGNCKVLVDDVSYLEEPMFQDGIIAQAVEEVSAQGAVYFSSAANNADYSSEYTNPVFTAAGYLNFNPTGTADIRQRFTIPAGARFPLVLQWSDPFYTTNGVKTDLDYFLINAAGDTVARANDSNIANQVPSEYTSYTNSTSSTAFDLVIRRRPGTADPTRVKYVIFNNGGSAAPTEYWTRSSTIYGHTAALSAGSTGALSSGNRLTPEPFTSKGSPTILFSPTGTPLATPVTRPKPDLAATDGSSNTFFGSLTPDPKDGYLFFGTSAAAPNAAAVAALLRQARPSLTPAQVIAQLKATAQDVNTPGFDELTGAGLINAYRAIFGNPVAAAAPFLETFDNLGLGQAWELTDRVAARTLVRSDFNPSSAPGQLVLDNVFPYYGTLNGLPTGVGTNEATLHLNLASAPAGGFVLTFRQKKFAGETDEQMPATFSGTSATDGVAISVDGTNWFRLVDLTGTAATTNYQTVSVNLTQAAQAAGLTLAADTRIRFQRYGRGQVDSYASTRLGGRAFDDILVSGPTATAAPVPLFTASVTTTEVCPGTTVQFQNTSLFDATSFRWTFPGGTPSSSTLPNPTVTYPTAGSYAVTLQATNANGTATRTVQGVVNISAARPSADFTFRQTPICPGGSIKFTSAPTACTQTYMWSFPGGTPSSSTVPNPTVTFVAAGTYTVSLTTTNANGSTTQTATVRVQAPAPVPFAETFSSGIPSAWTVLNPDNGLTWSSATNVVRKDGTRGGAVFMPFYDYATTGRKDSLQTPVLNLSTQARAGLHFDLAYAPVDNTYNDSLSVDVYAACTTTRLGRVYIKSVRTGLATTAAQTTKFVPSATTQWRQENADLSPFANQPIYLRFVAYNQYGNDLYLSNVRVDNIVLATGKAVAESSALQVYPNPVRGGAQLTLQLPAVKGAASVQLVDGLGRRIWQAQVELNSAAATTYTLNTAQSAGVYMLLCRTADGKLFSRRVVVE